MLRTVHCPLIAIIVTVLCSGVCGLRINQEDAVAVTDKFPYDNLDLESLQVVAPLIASENDIEIVPEDYITTILKSFEEKQHEHEDFQKDTILSEADGAVKQRVTRQATHQYTPLYPQLPSGPPYNTYQPQPSNNQPGQSPYQPQPGYNPYAPNPNQQQPGYNPYTLNPNQPQPGYNPAGQNPNQQQPGYNPYTQNPNQLQPGYNPSGQNSNQQQPSYNPYAQTPNPNQQQPAYKPYGQNVTPPTYNPYIQNATQPTFKPNQWNANSFNSSQPGNQNNNPNQGAYNPYAGQNPYNSRPNVPSYNSSSPGQYRPPNGQYPVQNQTYNYPLPNSGGYRPPNASGSSFTPPLAPYNPNYHSSSGNNHPVQQFNSTSQRPPYYNPSQYPSYNNNSRPNPAQWPSSANSQYPNYPGAGQAQGTYNATRTPQVSPYFPSPDGKFPSNAYNPSIPNYPPQNNNQGQNNFFYPQNNSSASYDPRKVPPQNFNYH